MYLMIEFRCAKCDDKEYGIVYYEKVRGRRCLIYGPKPNHGARSSAAMKYAIFSQDPQQQTDARWQLLMFTCKSGAGGALGLQVAIVHVMHFRISEF